MTTNKARATLHDTHARLPDVIEAAAALARSTDATVDDLLNCLDHGGLAAEFAALELYRRTSRPRPSSPKAVRVKRKEWEKFLANDLVKRR